METNDFLKEAIRMAVTNVQTGNGGPFGALVVRDGKIIGRGVNTVTTGNDPTAHAEVNAIRDACSHLGSFQLEGCEIYTSCEPCPMCLGAIYWARPDKVFYAAGKADAANIGFDDSFIYDEIATPLGDRKIPFISISLEEGLDPFKEWGRREDKVEY
jgi:tRNA(Arg) A34 adenosine deaminase TadA